MIGEAIGIVSVAVLSARDVVSKKLSASLSDGISAVTSFSMAIPFYLLIIPIMYLCGLEEFVFNKTFLFFIFLRAFLDAFAERLKMTAFANCELSVCMSIFSLSIIFQLILSPFITGDPITTKILIGAILSVAGTLIIFMNRSAKTNKKGLIAALLTTPIFAINGCLDRMCSIQGGPIWSAFLMTLVSGCFLLPFVPFKQVIKDSVEHRKPLLLRGFFEVGYMILKLVALIFITAPQSAIIGRLTVLFAVINGNLIFKELSFWRKAAGALFIIGGVVFASI